MNAFQLTLIMTAEKKLIEVSNPFKLSCQLMRRTEAQMCDYQRRLSLKSGRKTSIHIIY